MFLAVFPGRPKAVGVEIGMSLPRSCRTYASRLDFCPSPSEASLLLASSGPPSFASAALHGGFSSLSLKRSLREASLRLAHQKQASCLLLVCRLRSFSPPSVAAFPRYRSALSTVCESLDSPPSRSKPPACFFRAAFVRFRRPPWRLFFAIAQRSLREASLRLASP